MRVVRGSLPIPDFHDVLEVYNATDVRVLVAKDPNAGRRGRYSIIHIDQRSGRALCIGRELPLKYARKIAFTACNSLVGAEQ